MNVAKIVGGSCQREVLLYIHSMPNILLIIHLFSTMYMTGLIWFVQVVHYPLHGEVGSTNFLRYQELHVQWTGLVVMPPMLLELGTCLYFALNGYQGTPSWIWWTGLGLLGMVWASTGLLQVPAHNALMSSFTEATHHKLVFTNWIRTVGWTARSGLLLWVLLGLLER